MNGSLQYPNELTEILENFTLKHLLKEVEALYEGESLIILLDKNLDSHGAFHWEADKPTISINPKSGINMSNICHELIHALQLKKGFPFIRSNIYNDKRAIIVRELVSNILHIHFCFVSTNRKINTEEYISPTIKKMKTTLKSRKKKQIRTLPLLRIHYDSLAFLRIFYEAKHLNSKEKNHIKHLFKKYSPIAYDLTFELISIINKRNPINPEGSMLAILDCLNHLNGVNNVSSKRPDYSENLYLDSIHELKVKYNL